MKIKSRKNEMILLQYYIQVAVMSDASVIRITNSSYDDLLMKHWWKLTNIPAFTLCRSSYRFFYRSILCWNWKSHLTKVSELEHYVEFDRRRDLGIADVSSIERLLKCVRWACKMHV